MWTAHTSLTIQRAQYMLHNRMLQYIAQPISEEPPHAIRAPDGHLRVLPNHDPLLTTVNLTVESFFGSLFDHSNNYKTLGTVLFLFVFYSAYVLSSLLYSYTLLYSILIIFCVCYVLTMVA